MGIASNFVRGAAVAACDHSSPFSVEIKERAVETTFKNTVLKEK
jgi:hypothetical protein